MRWSKVLACALLAAGSWQLNAAAQQPPQTFRSGTQVVQVDVRILKDGRFVTDLGASDFTIKEDGVAQRIESAVLVAAPSAPPPSAPALSAPSALSAPAPSAPSAPLAPSAPSIWVFVFDTEHLSPGGLNRSRAAVVTFIGERFRQGEVGGVVFDGKMANNRLTTNHEELKAAAAAVKIPGELRSRQVELREWPRFQDDDEVWRVANGDQESLKAAVMRACNEDPDSCRRVPVEPEVLGKAKRLNTDTQRASQKTLIAVEALSTGLAKVPGTKTVVFFSEGFYVTDKIPELRRAIGQAARAGARLYTIDARGLNKGSASSQLMDQPVVSSAYGAQQTFDTQADGINSLGVDTGGLAIRNENDFGRALDDIQRDAGTYYVVSYTSSNPVFDGKYRTIDVGVDRPGVKVRARRGYLALEPAALLRPTPIPATVPAAAGGAPKPAADSAPATADTPALPVSPGLMALPEAPLAGDTITVPAVAKTDASAVRARIDAGRMVASLRSGESSAGANSPAELGWNAYQAGDVAAAAKHLAVAAADPSAHPWVHYALGLAEFAQQHYKDATTAWERVLRDVPEFEPIYFSLADGYGLQHDEGAALKVLREAARRWPNDPEVLDAIGVIQVKRGALDAAIDSFESATKIAPQEALGWFNLGRTLQMRWRKSQRYDKMRETWVGPDDDRKRAAAAFQKCLDIGGPYDSQARQALAALAWK